MARPSHKAYSRWCEPSLRCGRARQWCCWCLLHPDSTRPLTRCLACAAPFCVGRWQRESARSCTRSGEAMIPSRQPLPLPAPPSPCAFRGRCTYSTCSTPFVITAASTSPARAVPSCLPMTACTPPRWALTSSPTRRGHSSPAATPATGRPHRRPCRRLLRKVPRAISHAAPRITKARVLMSTDPCSVKKKRRLGEKMVL
mmetsp:Transcript_14188/g.45442  ORF Transcript_14188/g.45442 Transcript_14188/m.45442 type:complete len:200 (-) Transcript_14188:1017-1616(-)